MYFLLNFTPESISKLHGSYHQQQRLLSSLLSSTFGVILASQASDCSSDNGSLRARSFM